jgi:hypothetical protein
VEFTVFFCLSAESIKKENAFKKLVTFWRKNQVLRSFLLLPQCNLDFTCFLSESIKPSFLGCMRLFPAYFLSTLVLFLRVAFSELVSCKDLFSSQAEKDFDNENNTLTHTLTHSHTHTLTQKSFTFVGYLCTFIFEVFIDITCE